MAAAEQSKPTPPAEQAGEKKRTPPAEGGAPVTKRYLVTADCFRSTLGGWHKRGSYVTIPAGSKAVPSQTWTEVDGDGKPVEGGQKAKPIAKFVETKKALAGGKGVDSNERLAMALEAQTALLAKVLEPKKG